jgi:hypothetical protein
MTPKYSTIALIYGAVAVMYAGLYLGQHKSRDLKLICFWSAAAILFGLSAYLMRKYAKES